MAQTRMFRDRVVSMEQTLEGGEKHLDLLRALCREAFPELDYREHLLDHERDLFVMVLEAPDGRRRTVGWTRMTLFDAERVPALAADPGGPLRARVVEFLRARAARSEIVVTFRHLEDGWTDTPEPRPTKRRRRRGAGRGAGRPQDRPQPGRPAQVPGGEGPSSRPAPAVPGRPAPAPGRPGTPPPAGEAHPGGRRRFRRRRRGRGGHGGPPPPRTP